MGARTRIAVATRSPVERATFSEWLNSGGLVARMNFALQLADNRVPGVKVDTSKAAKPDDPVAGIALGSPEFQKH